MKIAVHERELETCLGALGILWTNKYPQSLKKDLQQANVPVIHQVNSAELQLLKWEHICIAYRKAVIYSHPDKASLHGFSQEVATENFMHIQKSWEYLKAKKELLFAESPRAAFSPSEFKSQLNLPTALKCYDYTNGFPDAESPPLCLRSLPGKPILFSYHFNRKTGLISPSVLYIAIVNAILELNPELQKPLPSSQEPNNFLLYNAEQEVALPTYVQSIEQVNSFLEHYNLRWVSCGKIIPHDGQPVKLDEFYKLTIAGHLVCFPKNYLDQEETASYVSLLNPQEKILLQNAYQSGADQNHFNGFKASFADVTSSFRKANNATLTSEQYWNSLNEEGKAFFIFILQRDAQGNLINQIAFSAIKNKAPTALGEEYLSFEQLSQSTQTLIFALMAEMGLPPTNKDYNALDIGMKKYFLDQIKPCIEPPFPILAIENGPGSGFFSSSISQKNANNYIDYTGKIKELIRNLNGEINGFFCLDRELKTTKKAGLELLLEQLSQEVPLAEAIQHVKNKYPDICKGNSSRIAQLFNQMVDDVIDLSLGNTIAPQ